MKTKIIDRVCLAISVLCFGLTMPLSAATIYNNSTNDLLIQFDPGTSQVGSEIILAGTERYVTDFSFEYWGVNSIHPGAFSGTIEAEVQFYLNDGTLFNGFASPSTSLFNSGWFSVPTPTDRNTFIFSIAGGDFGAGGLFLPVESNMTWTVQFRGMGIGDSVGVDLYGPPTVGQAYGDYWQYNGTSWALMTNSVAPPLIASFGANMVATVPEPSSLALSVLGGLGLLVAVRRFRRKG
jgi:hypothetical protein